LLSRRREGAKVFFTRRRSGFAVGAAVFLSQRRKGFFTRRRGGFAVGAAGFYLAKAQRREGVFHTAAQRVRGGRGGF
jgi:hypothetical protein